jgi:hypothetical protein
MEGWREAEILSKELLAPCGLYCGVCGVYIATRDDNKKFKAILARLYGTKPEETRCFGCMQLDQGKLHSYCKQCQIRECVRIKEYYSCHQCREWPCAKVDNFAFATGVRVMKRAIPKWREKVATHGHEEGSIAWARSECERYHCLSCGGVLFRGAQRCRSCGREVADDLDGLL